MPTQCSTDGDLFGAVDGRRVVSEFDGGAITSDAGGLLLGAADQAIGLIEGFAACFEDRRLPGLIEHSVATLVGQRVFAIALGYEDLNDHDELRHDPLMAVLAGKLAARRADCAPVAGKSTLNRLELSRPMATRYHKINHDPAAVETLFVTRFLDAHAKAPRQIILDLDATDDPLHGQQEGRFFHGYYDEYCYLPLYVFCGRHLLAAKLRPSNIDASSGAVEELARIVAQLRARWPRVRILLRADSGFAREALMAWCENNRVDFLFGLAGNKRLTEEIYVELAQAEEKPPAAAGRRAATRTSAMRPSTAGRAGVASSPRRNGRKARPIRASSSPRSSAARRLHASSMKTSTAPAARWKTASRSARATCSPIAPPPPRCAPTSCACGLPRWPMCSSVLCAASVLPIPNLPRRTAAPSASSS